MTAEPIEPEWAPGDPLFSRPYSADAGGHVRPIYQILDDNNRSNQTYPKLAGYCPRCEVYERNADVCWYCGEQTPRGPKKWLGYGL